MKTKLINKLRGKERKKRKTRYAKLYRSRWRRFIYILKINCKEKRTVGKTKKGINVEKYNRLKKLKLKKEKKKKGKLPRTTKAQDTAEVYNNNKKCDWEKKEKKSSKA